MPSSRLLRGPWRSITLAALAFLIGSATVVVATGSIPGPDGRIQGCYNQQNGNLRVVTSPADCRTTEIAIAWSQSGPQGLQGLKGDPGPAGPTGPTGPAGAPGASGAPGTTLTSLSQLAGLACTLNGTAGTTSLTFDATGQAKLTCVVAAAPTPTPGVTPPQLTITPLTYNYGQIALNTFSNAIFTVTNTGGTATTLPVSVSSSSPSFGIQGSTCSVALLAPAGTCTITVRFAPVIPGVVTGQITASAGPVVVGAMVSGTGAQPPTLSISPQGWSFGNVAVGSSATQSFTVSNSGGSFTGIPSVTAVPAPFEIIQNTCIAPLAPSNTCLVVVRFAPTTAGQFSSPLVISANPGGSVTAPLNGTAGTQLVTHDNGFGGTYLHARALGTPGNASTYDLSMAMTAAASVGAGGAEAVCVDGGRAVWLQQQVGGLTLHWLWTYTGPAAGRAVSSSGQPPTCSSVIGDRTWN